LANTINPDPPPVTIRSRPQTSTPTPTLAPRPSPTTPTPTLLGPTLPLLHPRPLAQAITNIPSLRMRTPSKLRRASNNLSTQEGVATRNPLINTNKSKDKARSRPRVVRLRACSPVSTLFPPFAFPFLPTLIRLALAEGSKWLGWKG
jgi:hypothetical protein